MLNQFENIAFGNINLTIILLNQFRVNNRKKINKSDLFRLCIEKNRDFASSYEGLLLLLDTFKIISLKDEILSVKNNLNIDKEELSRIIIDNFFSFLSNDDYFQLVFPSKSIKFNSKTSKPYLSRASIPRKYHYLINFFISSNLFREKNERSFLEINDNYLDKFKKELIKSNKVNQARRLTLDSLKAKLIKQEERGYEAEKFVFEFELKRLQDHNKKTKIEIISESYVNAGYDIISFENNDSDAKRFIEVKSFNYTLGFYWTSNEYSKAKEFGKQYYIYLVDYKKMKKNKKDYHPLIICNPFFEINNTSNWIKDEKLWYIKKK